MRRWQLAAIAAVMGAAGGCSDSYLFDPSAGLRGMQDRGLRVQGQFCTEATDDLTRPIKLLFAMDTSQSMVATDPDGTRAKALVDLLDALPDSPEIEVGVLLFAGDVLWLTNGGTSGFVKLQSMPPLDRERLAASILAYAYSGSVGTGPNRDMTDFVKPLDAIFATISADISKGHQTAVSSGTPELSRYSVIFLSDGHPREDEAQDGDIEVRCNAIRALRADALDVTLNTVHVFSPTKPVPTYCAPDAGACQAEIIEKDAARLRLMADKGGGEFRSFRNGAPVNFLSFRMGGIKRAFLLKDIQVFNLNAQPNSAVEEPDSDSDGLSDTRERALGTDPTLRDTDTDGISDGVEQYFKERGGSFNPVWRADGLSLDKGCPVELRGKDLDHDGLLDCDEQMMGTSNNRYDTDADGVPDVMEWLGKSQPSSPDSDEDPDRDGLVNALEMRMHTDPLLPEDAHLTDRAYRYQVRALTVGESSGKLCYQFSVDNVLLVPTLDVGQGTGVNHLLMTVVQESGDGSPPLFREARFTARYPTGGIKDPPDGIIPLRPTDFVAP